MEEKFETAINRLNERVDKVEKRNLELRVGGTVFGVCCMAFLGWQFSQSGEVMKKVLKDDYKVEINAMLTSWEKRPELVQGWKPELAELGLRLDDAQNELKDNAVWVTPENLLSNWKNYGGNHHSFSYRKGRDGYVHFRGLVKGGSWENPIFVLSSEYRPKKDLLFGTVSGSQIARLLVTADGKLIPKPGAEAYFSLDGISFHAEP